ncbi:MAG: YHS domain-containing protein [bacterium]
MKKTIAVLSIVAASLWAYPALAAPQKGTPQCGCGSHQKGVSSSFKSRPKVGTRAKCPVMKNVFTVGPQHKWSKYKGRYYVFCCPGCKPKFDKSPQKYAGR